MKNFILWLGIVSMVAGFVMVEESRIADEQCRRLDQELLRVKSEVEHTQSLRDLVLEVIALREAQEASERKYKRLVSTVEAARLGLKLRWSDDPQDIVGQMWQELDELRGPRATEAVIPVKAREPALDERRLREPR